MEYEYSEINVSEDMTSDAAADVQAGLPDSRQNESEAFMAPATSPDTANRKQPEDKTTNAEQLLDNFAVMLQKEMHRVANGLLSKITDYANRTGQQIETANTEIKDKFAKIVEQQEVTIQRQHLSISKFQEDLLYKVQKPLIMDIIGIADNIRTMLQMQESMKDYDLLLQSVKDLEKWVDATLANNSVRMFRDTENPEAGLNLKRQEIIDTEMTDDPNRHNTYVCERPGYVWSMPYLVVNSDVQLEKIVRDNTQPQMFSYVIRPEEIIRLRYKKE